MAHRLSLTAARLGRWPSVRVDPRLELKVVGLRFASPVGLAAGYDKDAEVPDAMLRLGFGFVETGTVTPLAQPGNPKPRVFRLVEDEALINRLGFNNRGQAAAHDRLARRTGRGVVGCNIGVNKDSSDRVGDFAAGIRAMSDVADYLTVNISSPNTPGLRALQDASALAELLAAVREARVPGGPPVFLKVAPDLDAVEIDAVARTAIDGGIDALIVSNTTILRPPLRSVRANESGGLSGVPLAPLAMAALRAFRGATGGSLPLIAAGGIDSAEEAYARIRAGASLVQIYTALVYHGPGLVQRMNEALVALLDRDGLATIGDAIGLDAV